MLLVHILILSPFTSVMRSNTIDKLSPRFITLIILCVVEVHSFQYTARVVKSIREENTLQVNRPTTNLPPSKVCEGTYDDRWSRCGKAVKITYCQAEKIQLDVKKNVGESKVYVIKEKGLQEIPILAYKCPAKPKPIYLADDTEKPPGHAHVIIVEKVSIGKRTSNFMGKFKNAISKEHAGRRIEQPTTNLGDTSSAQKPSAEDSRSEKVKERASTSGRSVRGDRSESGAVDNRSLSGSRSVRETSNREVSSAHKNHETSSRVGKVSPDRQSTRSRSSARRDQSASVVGKKDSSSQEHKKNELPRKTNADEIFQVDPSDSASNFEGPASVNNELYKDIQRNKSSVTVLNEGSRVDSAVPPSATRKEMSNRERMVAAAVERKAGAAAILKSRSTKQNQRTSRSGSVREGSVVSRAPEQAVVNKPASVILNTQPSKKDESIPEKTPKLKNVSSGSPEYVVTSPEHDSSGGKNIREKVQKVGTVDNSEHPVYKSASKSRREKVVEESPDLSLLKSRTIRERAVQESSNHSAPKKGNDREQAVQGGPTRSLSKNKSNRERAVRESPERSQLSGRNIQERRERVADVSPDLGLLSHKHRSRSTRGRSVHGSPDSQLSRRMREVTVTDQENEGRRGSGSRSIEIIDAEEGFTSRGPKISGSRSRRMYTDESPERGQIMKSKISRNSSSGQNKSRKHDFK